MGYVCIFTRQDLPVLVHSSPLCLRKAVSQDSGGREAAVWDDGIDEGYISYIMTNVQKSGV